MAMKKQKKQRRIQSGGGIIDFSKFPLGKRNFQLFGLGVGLIIIGYWLMSIGPADSVYSRTIAPVILVLSYCIVIPFAILYKDRTRQ